MSNVIQGKEAVTTASCVRNIAVSGLSVAAFLVAAAVGAEIGDSESGDQAAVWVSGGQREHMAAVNQRETAKQIRTVITNDDNAESDAHPFVSYGCYQCHGYLGQGGGSGPRLSGDMPYEAFQQVVRFPYGAMPAYPREILSDQDLREIYSYVEALPPPPEVKDLPLLYDTSK